MNKPDIFSITFDQNPALAEALRDKKIGDTLELEVHCTLKQQTAEGAEFTIEAVVPEGFELDTNQEDVNQSAGGVGALSHSDANMTPTAIMVRRMAP